MTGKDLETMVQALTDGSLSELEFIQLQDELRANAGSRAFFRQSMEVEMLLVEAMGQHIAMGQTRGRTEAFLHQRRRRDLTRALLATAAILMVAAVVMALVIIRQPEKPTLSCSPVPGTQWQVKGQGLDSEMNARNVAQGSTVRVLSGSLKLELESGVVMLMRGPAEVAFPKPDRPVIRHGWLWIDSDKSSDPVEVPPPPARAGHRNPLRRAGA